MLVVVPLTTVPKLETGAPFASPETGGTQQSPRDSSVWAGAVLLLVLKPIYLESLSILSVSSVQNRGFESWNLGQEGKPVGVIKQRINIWDKTYLRVSSSRWHAFIYTLVCLGNTIMHT